MTIGFEWTVIGSGRCVGLRDLCIRILLTLVMSLACELS